MSHEQEAERGRLAAEVLSNPVYVESYTVIEAEIHRQWAESRDKDDREHLHRLLMALSKVRGVMETTLRNGRVAEKELERKRTLSERVGLRRVVG